MKCTDGLWNRPVRRCLLFLVIAVNPVWADDDILKLSGMPAEQGGVCLVLDCGDGKLAAELTRETKCTVVALARDEADCAKARETLEEAGLCGTRAAAVVFSPETLPFPKGYGNLIVAENFDPGARNASPLLREVRRVLNPNGVAVIGGAKTDAAGLKPALDQAEVKDYRISGRYAVIRGRMPEGSDDWTHYRHDPSNNPVSSDATIRPPFRTQWILSPARSVGAVTLVSQGRLVLLDGGPGRAEPGRLFARDAFNGTSLWQHKLNAPSPSQRGLVILADKVYVIDEGDKILVLEAATGRDLKTYKAPEGSGISGRWQAFFLLDDVLYVRTASPKDAEKGPGPTGGFFFAMDLADGKVLWTYRCEKPIIELSAAVGDGACYFYCPDAGVIALDLKTGRERWKNTELAADIKKGGSTGFMSNASWSVFAGGKVLFYGIGKTLALDSRTGKLLWTLKSYRAPLFVADKIYTYARGGDALSVMDASAGSSVGTLKLPASMPGCGSGTASVSAIFSAGQGFATYDLRTNQDYSYNVFRTPCGLGSTLADGLVFTTPFSCNCNYAITGQVALAPAGENWQVPDGKKDWESRLEQGPAFASPLALDGAPEEWPSYRHDPRHSAVADTTVKLPLKVSWERKLSGTLTAPSTGGGLVYVGSSDGHVWGLDGADGTVRWKFLSGAEVPVTPTWWRGRALFGSHDGCVYCLEAATGKLVWKFRAAPEDRYILVLDRPTSTWPVQTGVVVEGGVAYFAAGMCSYDGAYLYALDAATGKPVYASRIGPLNELGGGVNPQGAMALSGDRLYVPQGGHHPACFAKNDGRLTWWQSTMGQVIKEAKVEYAKFNYSGGTELVVERDILLVGGPRLIGDRGYPFLISDAATGLPYGTVAAVKEHKAVLSKIGLLWEHYLGGVGTPVLSENVVYSIGGWPKRLVIAYDLMKLAGAHVVGMENRERAAGEARLWSASVPADAHSLILAGPHVVVAGKSGLNVLEKKDGGKTLGSVKVSGTIAGDGLAAAKGRLFAVTREGSVFGID